MLKALNRQIYFECPTYLTIQDRIRALLERLLFSR